MFSRFLYTCGLVKYLYNSARSPDIVDRSALLYTWNNSITAGPIIINLYSATCRRVSYWGWNCTKVTCPSDRTHLGYLSLYIYPIGRYFQQKVYREMVRRVSFMFSLFLQQVSQLFGILKQKRPCEQDFLTWRIQYQKKEKNWFPEHFRSLPNSVTLYNT